MSDVTRDVVQHYLQFHPADAARQLEEAAPGEASQLLGEESPTLAAQVLRYVQPDHAAQIVAAAGAEGGSLIAALDPALAATLLARLSEDARNALLADIPAAAAKEVRAILAFPPGTAGSLMDARVALFGAETRVEDALSRVRGLRDRRVTDLILTNDEGEFDGSVRLQDVVGADPDQQLAELKSPRPLYVQPMTPREDVVELLSQYRVASLPVVDLQNRVVGIIRQAGLVEAAQEDAVSDLQQMVGGSAEERALSSPWTGVKSRLPWLNINLVTAFLAAAVVGLFEGTIARFTAVAVLLPVVAGQSGNTGAQALAVTMRGLALREIRVSDGLRVLAKELIVGLINGVAIAIVTSIGVYVWSGNVGLVLVMFLAMVIAMVVASAAGAMIPVILVKLNRDPATASSIVLTTVTDVVGFFTFLGLATWFAGMLASP